MTARRTVSQSVDKAYAGGLSTPSIIKGAVYPFLGVLRPFCALFGIYRNLSYRFARLYRKRRNSITSPATT